MTDWNTAALNDYERECEYHEGRMEWAREEVKDRLLDEADAIIKALDPADIMAILLVTYFEHEFPAICTAFANREIPNYIRERWDEMARDHYNDSL